MKKTNKSESKHVNQDVKVQGQRRVLSEKQRTVKWY